MNCIRSKVGLALGISPDLVAQSLELPASHVGEILPRITRCRALVEIDRDAQLLSYALAELFGERDAVFHRRIFERNEWNDVGSSDPGMLTGVLPQIDALGRCANSLESCLNGMIDGHDERDY